MLGVPETSGARTASHAGRHRLFQLPRSIADQIIAHAQQDDPNECCGLLAAEDDQVVAALPAPNAAASPYRYTIDSKDLLRLFREIEWGDKPWRVAGNYHSHTHSEAYPSPTDVREAHLGPDATYLIVSLRNPTAPEIRAFRINDETHVITEEPLQVVDL